uniref:Dynein heavy chain AAA lid domain-containing protein n=1 Tax=Sinocyclocheilus rhinocerous TaxID=307959 RepID=A0A673L2V3_9TELE
MTGRCHFYLELENIKTRHQFNILKVTYEAPPGLNKNLKRTYESWSVEQISKGGHLTRAQSLFCLAWFHSVCQERRNYIPQGWTKIFSSRFFFSCFSGGKSFQWEFVHGLLENAIYSGRINNVFDLRVLRSYLQQFFNAQLLTQSHTHSRVKKTHALIHLPNSCSIADYRAVVDALPEDNRPSFFGLPANIEHSAQRIISSQVISQLRILSRSVAAGSKFDQEIWSNALSPVLNLWKCLNQGSSLIHQKVAPPSEGVSSPVLSFVQLEQACTNRWPCSVRGTSLLTADIHKLVTALLNQECPLSWQNKWEDPEDPSCPERSRFR